MSFHHTLGGKNGFKVEQSIEDYSCPLFDTKHKQLILLVKNVMFTWFQRLIWLCEHLEQAQIISCCVGMSTISGYFVVGRCIQHIYSIIT
jgi:hypothetical protein